MRGFGKPGISWVTDVDAKIAGRPGFYVSMPFNGKEPGGACWAELKARVNR